MLEGNSAGCQNNASCTNNLVGPGVMSVHCLFLSIHFKNLSYFFTIVNFKKTKNRKLSCHCKPGWFGTRLELEVITLNYMPAYYILRCHVKTPTCDLVLDLCGEHGHCISTGDKVCFGHLEHR